MDIAISVVIATIIIGVGFAVYRSREGEPRKMGRLTESLRRVTEDFKHRKDE